MQLTVRQAFAGSMQYILETISNGEIYYGKDVGRTYFRRDKQDSR